MNKKTKNLLCIGLLVLLLAVNLLAVSLTASSKGPADNQPPQGDAQQMQPPGSPGAPNTGMQTQPHSPDGQTGAPQQAPGIQNGAGTQTQPRIPGGQGGKPRMPNGRIGFLSYAAFFLCGLSIAALLMYLILSKGNNRTFHETFQNKKSILLLILCTIVIGCAIGACDLLAAGSGGPGAAPAMPETASTQSVSASGAMEVTDAQTLSEGTYSSTQAKENALLVKAGGTLTLFGGTVTKTGDCSNPEESDFYGLNAAILVTENSSAALSGLTVTTDGAGANAVFATGENAKIQITDSTIETSGERSSRGLDATYGGSIKAERVTITTKGGSCAALATDRGEGTILAKNCTLATAGAGSPIVYSTGDITVEDSTGTADGAQCVVIEGKNSATLINSRITASAKGNRGETDVCGVMIYQSMSGDADAGTGTLTAQNSTLMIDRSSQYYQSAPMFFITNTQAVINLKNTTLDFGSGVLLSAKGTDAWGTAGSNGGAVSLNAEDQKLSGRIVLDSLSGVDLVLKNSAYTGSINEDRAGKSATLTLDQNSTLTLTGDCYLTGFTNAVSDNSNIAFGSYHIYVNGSAIQ